MMTSARWSRLTEWPLMAVALLFLAAYSVQVIVNPGGTAGALLEDAIWVTWIVFVTDYAVSLWLAENRRRWFVTHLFDLVTVVVPMIRPLRALRLVTLLRVLHRTAGRAVRGQIALYAIGATVLLVYVAALAVLDAERGSGSGIDSFGDAIWWAFVTLATVGYGDMAPITVMGRTIAVGLMLGGIAVVGVITGTLTSWIVERVSRDEAAAERLTVEHIGRLQDEISALRQSLTPPGAEPTSRA